MASLRLVDLGGGGYEINKLLLQVVYDRYGIHVRSAAVENTMAGVVGYRIILSNHCSCCHQHDADVPYSGELCQNLVYGAFTHLMIAPNRRMVTRAC